MSKDNLISIVVAAIVGVITIILIKLRMKKNSIDISGLPFAKTSQVANIKGLAAKTKSPLNMRDSANYEFRYQTGSVNGFAAFARVEHGLRAAIKLIWFHYYTNKRNTINKLVAKWAPPTENNTNHYIQSVAKGVGIGEHDVFEFNTRIVTSIMIHMAIMECGFRPTEKQMKEAWTLSQDYSQW